MNRPAWCIYLSEARASNMTQGPTVKRTGKRRVDLLVLLFFFIAYCGFSAHRYEPYTFTKGDPAWMAQTVISLASDGDIDLRNQLNNDPARAADQTARGRDGAWMPLHEPTLAVVSLPFYLAGGINGLLLFNILCAATLQTLIFLICRHVASPLLAFAATLLTGFTTLFLNYSYSYSLDLWGATLVVASFAALLNRRPTLGGALLGFAILSRHVTIVAAPGILLLLWFAEADERHKSLLRFILGGLPFAAILFAYNIWAFGSPWQTSYHFWQLHTDGALRVVDQLHTTFVNPWKTGIISLVVDERSGLRGSIPAWPLLLAGMLFSFRKHSGVMLSLLVITLGHLLFFCRFEGYPGAPGNRYLMPVVALSALPIAALLQGLKARFQREKANDSVPQLARQVDSGR